MKALKKKLKSQKGATMLFAIVAMVVVIVVAAVIIQAAYSNMVRAKETKNSEQAYMNVYSVSQEFYKALVDQAVSCTADRVTKKSGGGLSFSETTLGAWEEIPDDASPFREKLLEFIAESDGEATTSFLFTATSSYKDDDYDETYDSVVRIDVEIAADKSITATFVTTDEKSSKVTGKTPASVEEAENGYAITGSYPATIHAFTEKAESVTEGSDDSAVYEEVPCELLYESGNVIVERGHGE